MMLRVSMSSLHSGSLSTPTTWYARLAHTCAALVPLEQYLQILLT
jgi:hypothetical protein